MDGAIRGIPSVYGPRSIGQNGRGNQRRGKGFEEAMEGKDPGGVVPDPDDAPDSAAQSGLDPVPKGLQDHRPPGRRGDEGRRQIDILA